MHESELLYRTCAQVRARKSSEEVRLVRQAVALSELGLFSLLTHFQEPANELQLSAYFQSNLKYLANVDACFEPLVSVGANCGFPRHRPHKFKHLAPGGLAVLELGARAFGYCGVVARTLPVSGSFSEKQRRVYQVFEAKYVQLKTLAKPGVSLANSTLRLLV